MKGSKQCPNCQSKLGPRTKVCPTCQHNFFAVRPTISSSPKHDKSDLTKLTKLIKLDKKAKKDRVINYRKLKPKNAPVLSNVDWTTLIKGDRIKVVGGGPYHMQWLDLGESKRCDMGCSGIMSVGQLHETGILCYEKGGATFVYMGKSYFDEINNIFMEPHIIQRVESFKK